MTARKALATGLRAARQRPLLVLGIFGIDVVLSWLATLPFHETFASATEMRPFADPLAGGLKLDILSEVFARRPDVTVAGTAGALAGTVAWIVLQWFLVAGVMGLLREPVQAATFRRFGAEAAAHGFAMMRLQLWSLLAYLVAAIVIWIGGMIGYAIGGRAVNPWVGAVAIGVGMLPGLFAWLFVATSVDVGRARTVLLSERAMLSTLFDSFRQVKRNPRTLIGIQFLGGLLWVGITLLHVALTWPFQFSSVTGLAVFVLIRQVTVLLRHGVRIGSLGGTLEVVRATAPSAGATELVPATAGVN